MGSITLNRDTVKEFKRAYTKATDAGRESFWWGEDEVLCSYAFYVLQFYYQQHPFD